MIGHMQEGVVVSTDDPQQEGRLQVWCPTIDGAERPDTLPWTRLGCVMAGQTRDYPAGDGAEAPGLMSYGVFAVPKVGAIVLVALVNGDPNDRVYVCSVFRTHGNRSLPVGRNRPDLGVDTPLTDTLDPVEPQTSNLRAQFSGETSAPQARTRGAYERQVAQDRTDKDGSEGYQRALKAPSGLDPQTYCITTPGRHSLIFQDNPENARVRIKTAGGAQVILDDANERIYVSTARGDTWLELDQDGHVHLYGAASFSVAAGRDINLTAGGSFSVAAGGDISLSAGGSVRASACSDVSLSGDGGALITSGAGIDFLAAGTILQTGSTIHLNGPGAATAPCAGRPSVVPGHEPWPRPAGATTRGRHWKP